MLFVLWQLWWINRSTPMHTCAQIYARQNHMIKDRGIHQWWRWSSWIANYFFFRSLFIFLLSSIFWMVTRLGFASKFRSKPKKNCTCQSTAIPPSLGSIERNNAREKFDVKLNQTRGEENWTVSVMQYDNSLSFHSVSRRQTWIFELYYLWDERTFSLNCHT